MKTNIKRATARLSRNGKFMVVEMNGQNAILNANLIRYLFDIPYTRKNGTRVTTDQIFELKEKAQAAYDAKVRSSAG